MAKNDFLLWIFLSFSNSSFRYYSNTLRGSLSELSKTYGIGSYPASSLFLNSCLKTSNFSSQHKHHGTETKCTKSRKRMKQGQYGNLRELWRKITRRQKHCLDVRHPSDKKKSWKRTDSAKKAVVRHPDRKPDEKFLFLLLGYSFLISYADLPRPREIEGDLTFQRWIECDLGVINY